MHNHTIILFQAPSLHSFSINLQPENIVGNIFERRSKVRSKRSIETITEFGPTTSPFDIKHGSNPLVSCPLVIHLGLSPCVVSFQSDK